MPLAPEFWLVWSNRMPSQGTIVSRPGMSRLSKADRIGSGSVDRALSMACASVMTAVKDPADTSVISVLYFLANRSLTVFAAGLRDASSLDQAASWRRPTASLPALSTNDGSEK